MNSNRTPCPRLYSREIAPAVHVGNPAAVLVGAARIVGNRSIYIAPLAAAGCLFVRLPDQPDSSAATNARHAGARPGAAARSHLGAVRHRSGLIMAVAMIVGVFYCLEALHGERRDRSILFWKSLPVSDVTTVLVKASIPLVILQLIAFVLTVATQFIMLLLSSAVLRANGMSVANYWAQVSFFQMSLMIFYHLFTVHVLGHAPIYAWFLLVSGWARRAAFLWALLPPIAIMVVEKIAFNTHYFASMLGAALSGGAEAIPFADRMPIDPATQLTPAHFLLSPGLWIGLAVTAAFLFAAVRVRRYREPI